MARSRFVFLLPDLKNKLPIARMYFILGLGNVFCLEQRQEDAEMCSESCQDGDVDGSEFPGGIEDDVEFLLWLGGM